MITQMIGHTAIVAPSNAAVAVSRKGMPKKFIDIINANMSATEQACHAGNFKTISAITNHIIGASAAKNKLSKTVHPLYRKNIYPNGTLKNFNVPKFPAIL